MARIEKNNTGHGPAQQNSRSNEDHLGWMFFAVILVAVFVFVGAAVTVECERTRAHGAVNCTKQTRLLWIFSLPKDKVYNVVGARLASIPGDEYCDPCYRVEFEMPQGIVPLKAAYTNGSSGMSTVVEKVNDFVRGETPATLVVTDPGLLSVENLFWVALWGAGSYLWGKIKEVFRRRRNE